MNNSFSLVQGEIGTKNMSFLDYSEIQNFVFDEDGKKYLEMVLEAIKELEILSPTTIQILKGSMFGYETGFSKKQRKLIIDGVLNRERARIDERVKQMVNIKLGEDLNSKYIFDSTAHTFNLIDILNYGMKSGERATVLSQYNSINDKVSKVIGKKEIPTLHKDDFVEEIADTNEDEAQMIVQQISEKETYVGRVFVSLSEKNSIFVKDAYEDIENLLSDLVLFQEDESNINVILHLIEIFDRFGVFIFSGELSPEKILLPFIGDGFIEKVESIHFELLNGELGRKMQEGWPRKNLDRFPTIWEAFGEGNEYNFGKFLKLTMLDICQFIIRIKPQIEAFKRGKYKN